MCFAKKTPAARKTLLLGTESVGKSRLFQWLTLGDAGDTQPTEGFVSRQTELGTRELVFPSCCTAAQVINVASGEALQLQRPAKKVIQLIDLGGGEAYRERWIHHFSGVRGVVYVVDVSDKAAMDLKEQLNSLYEALDHPSLQKINLLICLNKADLLDGAEQIRRERDMIKQLKLNDSLQDLLEDGAVSVVTTSFLKGVGAAQVAEFLATYV